MTVAMELRLHTGLPLMKDKASHKTDYFLPSHFFVNDPSNLIFHFSY